ncbi:MAG TPA: carbamoyltransferase HypF [Cellulomonas sp.]|nr:carbamoyltransferase HypF [Cellulomonas sp.]
MAASARASAQGCAAGPAVGARLVVDGVVQGVGFRPFVWRTATELGLTGRVRNVAGRVEIDVAGPAADVAVFTARLGTHAPARARVDRVRSDALDVAGLAWTAAGFTIEESVTGDVVGRLFPPDLATCDACLAEVRDPANRRYRYAFTNCTDCGPRATIIDDLPYDRAATTMREFPLCPACAAEYRDPADRRFHAEPVACPACGPRLTYRPATGGVPTRRGDDALGAAAADLLAGRSVAVKGLGGYHLACDATDESAVARLRDRKHRWAKPFAVMVADVADARRLAHLDDAELAVLTGPARPIVLLAARTEPVGGHAAGTAQLVLAPHEHADRPLAPSVTAGAAEVGVLLPYTPLHHLLLAAVGRPLVLTSANLADEPLVTDDEEALSRLAGIADAFLAHDRQIRARYDDTVTRVIAGRESVVRRGRGYAPAALTLPIPATRTLLAVGAELKHTFTLARGPHAHVAPHNGDLEDLRTHDAFTAGLAHLARLVAIDPEVVVHDLHPEYLSTKYAVARFSPDRRMAVQHHHAHVASCAAEHGVTGPFLGVAYDGLGMGDDGTLWGGEVLVADLASYRRFARFGRAPLPGGALAVRRPYRMALGYLLGAEQFRDGDRMPDELVAGFTGRLDPREVDVVRTQVSRGLNAPQASSAGRLFDAVAALLGLRDVAEYEAQAAIDLERAAADLTEEALPYRLTRADDLLVFDPMPTLTALLARSAAGAAPGDLAAAFHETVVEVTRELLAAARAQERLEVVCLSGGVLQNRRLAGSLLTRLTGDGFEVHLNHQVPCNDGGISYGQAAVAAARLATDRPGSSTPFPASQED